MSDSLDSGLASSDAMKLNAASKSFLLESAKWAKFLAVVGFVMIGLMILVMLIGASFASGAGLAMGPALFMVVIMAAIYFFPAYFLFLFATNVKEGLVAEDLEKVTLGFQNLKRMFLYIGVLTIILLSIYLLIFLVGGAAGMLAGFG
ncbi:MAG: hypothetical protein ACJASQ_002804 [Crocinitomicaceae bacterium]|jgi:hypothetical protein